MTARAVVVYLMCACVLSVGPALAQGGKGLGTQEHEVGGVDVTLLEVKRSTGNDITVKWQYHNKTKQAKQLTKQRTGWIDPYRLSSDSYLADPDGRIKYPVLKDTDRRPIASRNGAPNQYITIGPNQTISVWARYGQVPENLTKISVFFDGVAPFEDVPISK